MNRIFPLAAIALSSVVAAQAPPVIDWHVRAVGTTPKVGSFSAATYDPSNPTGPGVLHFGSPSMAGPTQTSWFDGTTWFALNPTTSPSARTGHKMATYAPGAGGPQVLLFGGLSQGVRQSDTWQWNGTNWAQAAPVTVPPARDRHAMAGSGQNVLMFGGIDAQANLLGDTWVWNGANWNQLFGPVGLTARTDHAMATLANNDVLLFGGNDGSVRGDTWLFQAATQTWVQLQIAGPPARQAHSMAFDSFRGVVVLYGGVGASGGLSDTWEFKPGVQAWSQVGPTNTPPSLAYQAHAYDPARKSFVLLDSAQGKTWMYTYSATYSVFAEGCSGAIGIPTLDPAPGSVPRVGGSLQLLFANLFPQNPGANIFLVSGTAVNPQGTPVLPGRPECLFYVAGTMNTTLVPYNGGTGTTASITIPVPNNLTLLGMLIAHQAIVPDPTQTGGYALTSAASGYIGL